jgi:hypothetical protein
MRQRAILLYRLALLSPSPVVGHGRRSRQGDEGRFTANLLTFYS